jgi:hypothetical protein
MKKTAMVAGCLFVSLAVLVLNSFGAEEHQASASAAIAKEAVSKVLAAHSFTPPVAVAGPQGTVWYISSRSLAAHSVQQAIIGVHHGNSFSVELSGYRRDKAEEPWKETAKATDTAVVTMEKSVKEQLQKELGMEERSAKPAAPAEKEKAK